MLDFLKKVSRFEWSCAFGGFVLLVLLILFVAPRWQTDAALSSAMENLQKLDNPPAHMELEEKDGWGHPLIFRFERSATRLTYKVISVGPDGKEGTEDDRVVTHVDYNVSRMVGEWSVEKAKEFLKGIKQGWDKKSKYDEPEAKQPEAKP